MAILLARIAPRTRLILSSILRKLPLRGAFVSVPRKIPPCPRTLRIITDAILFLPCVSVADESDKPILAIFNANLFGRDVEMAATVCSSWAKDSFESA